MPEIEANFDGKWTVQYSVDGQISAIRVLPEFGYLIAAAPDMLAALKALVDHDEAMIAYNILKPFVELERARAVIAKAEGKL